MNDADADGSQVDVVVDQDTSSSFSRQVRVCARQVYVKFITISNRVVVIVQLWEMLMRMMCAGATHRVNDDLTSTRANLP